MLPFKTPCASVQNSLRFRFQLLARGVFRRLHGQKKCPAFRVSLRNSADGEEGAGRFIQYILFLHFSGRHSAGREVGKGVGLAVVVCGTGGGAGAGPGRENPRGAAAPGEGDGGGGALAIRNREEEDVSGGGGGREVERGGDGFNIQAITSQVTARIVFVISHLHAVVGGDAQAGATVGEVEREGLAQVTVSKAIRLHHRDGGAAIGSRDSD